MKTPKPQPATRELTCQVCGRVYPYPERGSESTRHLCAVCAGLPARTIPVLKRLSQRIRSLERTVQKLSNPPTPRTKPETPP